MKVGFVGLGRMGQGMAGPYSGVLATTYSYRTRRPGRPMNSLLGGA